MRYNNIIILAIALLVSATSFAQRPGQRSMRQQKQQFKSELNLTAEQEQQIQAINEEYKAKFMALRESEIESAAKRSQMQELRKAQREAVQSVFTEEQKAQLKTLREEAREEQKDRRANFDKEGLKTELQAHRTNKVEPVLKAQRAKLENQLSDEDKAFINQLRSDFNTVGKRMKKGPRTGERRQFKGFTEEEKAKHEQLKGLVEKYKEDIDALLAEIKPQAKQWKEDTREIYEKYRPETTDQPVRRMQKTKSFKGEKGKKGKERGQKGERRKGELKSFMSKGRFLLLDPASSNTDKLQMQPLNEIRSYPNPATNLNTVQYTVKQAGQIRIELRDRQGQVLRVLLDDRQENGSYTLDVDISQLKNGVYYYTIIDAQGQRTEKLVISN